MRRLWLLALVIGLAHAQPSIEAGRELYMGACSGCHGATGEGSQGPSLLSGRAGRLSHQTIATIIRKGVTGSSMPDFPLLPAPSVANIATFVRSLTAVGDLTNSLTKELDLTLPANHAGLRVIAFVQDRTTGRILAISQEKL